MITWDGKTTTAPAPQQGRAAARAEAVCRAACPGWRSCACPCHDAGDRVRALLAERFPGMVP